MGYFDSYNDDGFTNGYSPQPPQNEGGWAPAVQRWPDFDYPLWKKECTAAAAVALPAPPCAIAVSDWHAGALGLAHSDAQRAGVVQHIQLSSRSAAVTTDPTMLWQYHHFAACNSMRSRHKLLSTCSIPLFFNEDADVFRPPFTPDVVVVNPPWDMRLGGAVDSWRNLLQFLKNWCVDESCSAQHCTALCSLVLYISADRCASADVTSQCGGSTAWVLSGNADVTRELRMKSEKSVFLALGGTEMRWLQYKMLAPRHDSRSDAPGSECKLVLLCMQHCSTHGTSIDGAGAITAAAALIASSLDDAAMLLQLMTLSNCCAHLQLWNQLQTSTDSHGSAGGKKEQPWARNSDWGGGRVRRKRVAGGKPRPAHTKDPCTTEQHSSSAAVVQQQRTDNSLESATAATATAVKASIAAGWCSAAAADNSKH
eukprot:16994-Heterococcus_DN1.PRE.6